MGRFMRINKYISHHTKYSRREADALILAGRVKVHTKLATPSSIVEENDKVFIDGRYIKPKDPQELTAIIYHKPKGELVSKKDDRGRKTIYHSLSTQYRHFLPVGRLDYTSEGLLILCDNVKIVSTLMQSSLPRTYLIKLNGSITQAMQEAMQNGLTLEDATPGAHANSPITSMEFSPFTEFSIIKNTRNYSRLKVTITEGKNRELRRFFAHFGKEVLDLKRISFGFTNLNALPCGKTRYFTREEYKALHQFIKQQRSI